MGARKWHSSVFAEIFKLAKDILIPLPALGHDVMWSHPLPLPLSSKVWYSPGALPLPLTVPTLSRIAQTATTIRATHLAVLTAGGEHCSIMPSILSHFWHYDQITLIYKYFEFKNSWGCCPNSNSLLSSFTSQDMTACQNNATTCKKYENT